ncbi:MAG TPA: xanthine dehydrogenase family protein molybdopterin-binding subunit [Xanthobacteraceae bacterium]|nr:xanthine dehydrogenase family protein molybdopterin-binding subunit [Xanthobacteraceae bacterium]
MGGDRPFVGRSVPRLEDRPLLTGQSRFAADISFAQQVHMRVVRSAHAHGRIRAIDSAHARAAPGVVAVWTAADVADIPPIDFRLTRIEGLEPYRQPILAKDFVRYVGEPVAAVFAVDPYSAEDAAELVAVDIDKLPETVAADPAPVEFGPGHSSEAAVVRKGYGDVAAAFATAHTIVALELRIGRHSGVPLETRGAIARFDSARDVLELYGAAKVPHWNRDALARMLGLPASSVHLHEGHTGGGFGVRGELYPEDALACLGALRLRRPVKWIEDRREHLIATNHSREQHYRVRAAADESGRLLAVDGEFFHDQGAYMRTHAATVPDLAATMLLGPYRVAAYRMVGRIRLTNKTPCGTYRAPGRYESTFVRERLMDAIAARLHLDPIEVRRRNFITAAEMPYARPLDTLGTEMTYDSGDYGTLLDKALAATGWHALRQAVKRRRAAGEAVGAGLAFFVEKSGLGPYDTVHASIDASGTVEIVSGATSVGQGMETVIAQICADELGVDYRQIRVVHGQTDRIAFGMGTFASRVTVMTGEASRRAAAKLRAKAIAAAAHLLQSPPDTLRIANGRIARKESPRGPSVTLGEVAKALNPGGRLVGDATPGLAADGWFESAHMNYPYGIHFAVVRIDRDTGAVVVERYVVAYDIGKAVNPMLVEGQIAGGVAQGLGGALFEEFLYDPRGEPICVTFADYVMPTAREIPPIEVLISEDAPSPLNSLGVKGAGEGGANAAGAAIASAIDDALGRPGAVTQLPVTPRRLRDMVRIAISR